MKELVRDLRIANDNLYCENQMLEQKVERLHSIIKEVREYIENNSLYEQDEYYDYEENLILGEPTDELAKKELLEILDKVDKE